MSNYDAWKTTDPSLEHDSYASPCFECGEPEVEPGEECPACGALQSSPDPYDDDYDALDGEDW